MVPWSIYQLHQKFNVTWLLGFHSTAYVFSCGKVKEKKKTNRKKKQQQQQNRLNNKKVVSSNVDVMHEQ